MIIFLVGTFYISATIQGDNPVVDNNSGGGISVFYKTLRELKLPVERTLTPINESHIEDIQIVVQSKSADAKSKFDIESPEVQEWVSDGGILVYLLSDNVPFMDFSNNCSSDFNSYKNYQNILS